MVTIILDAGHGGNDLGDAYGHRYEKDDNLRLTLAVGEELELLGYNVLYIRVSDVFIPQYDRVSIANESEGKLLFSIHRIIGELPLFDSGLGFSVDSLGGIAENTAINVAEELRPLGFENFSIIVRTDYPILRDTNMPALMMGFGYLNSDHDNFVFDTRLSDIAHAIAVGISETIPLNSIEHVKNIDTHIKSSEEEEIIEDTIYAVQVGLFAEHNNAVNLNNELLMRGYHSQIIYKEPFYAVLVGAYNNLDYVAALEFCLRLEGYNTLVVAM